MATPGVRSLLHSSNFHQIANESGVLAHTVPIGVRECLGSISNPQNCVCDFCYSLQRSLRRLYWVHICRFVRAIYRTDPTVSSIRTKWILTLCLLPHDPLIIFKKKQEDPHTTFLCFPAACARRVKGTCILGVPTKSNPQAEIPLYRVGKDSV